MIRPFALLGLALVSALSFSASAANFETFVVGKPLSCQDAAGVWQPDGILVEIDRASGLVQVEIAGQVSEFDGLKCTADTEGDEE